MYIINNKTVKARLRPGDYAGYSFLNCVFDHCAVLRQSAPENWNTIRDIELCNVTHESCSIDTAIIQDVSLRDLKKKGRFPLFLWGCAFKHVKLSGKISALKINRYVDVEPSAALQRAWDSELIEFYNSPDWAIDISQAIFTSSVSFEAVPGDKIIRDPETQALVTRAQLHSNEWQSISYGSTGFDIAINWFLEHSLFDSVVIAARVGSKEAKADIGVLKTLRARGLAT